MNPFALPWFKRMIINGLLLVVLVGILSAYAFVIVDLPRQIYTPDQRAFLSENSSRVINQISPTWNFLADGPINAAAIFPMTENRVSAVLKARVEEKEGLNVTVYDLAFQGEYRLAYPGPGQETKVELFFPFPANLKTLYAVSFLVDGKEPLDAQYAPDGIRWQTGLKAGEEHAITIAYRANGANSFGYSLNRSQRTNVFVTVAVEGLSGSQVTAESLPVSQVKRQGGQEIFSWAYSGLIANRDIALTLPTQPSFIQRAAELQRTFRSLAVLAPLLVAGFVLALAGLFWFVGLRLPLEHYLMIACGVALYYPLLTFFSGIIEIYLAAALALILVGGLILVFLGLSLNYRQVWWRTGLMVALFPGVFSLGTLTSYQGLFVSGGGFLLVAILMVTFALHRRDSQHLKAAAATEPGESIAAVDHEAMEDRSLFPEAE